MNENYIENWHDLSLEEKNRAQNDLIEKKIIQNKFFDYESAKFFLENGYIKVENFLTEDMSDFFYDYVKLSTKRLLHLINEEVPHDSNVYGTLGDSQAYGDYSKYGDMLFDTLLAKGLHTIKYSTGIDVIPTYSYHRLYTTNTELKKHIDRPSCEISTTLFLGHYISNLKDKTYNWPMFVRSAKDNKDIGINLNPGDLIVYRGCDVEHWREKFLGNNHAQCFLHYNDANGDYNIKYDGRPELGLPSTSKINMTPQNKDNLINQNKKIDLNKIDYVT